MSAMPPPTRIGTTAAAFLTCNFQGGGAAQRGRGIPPPVKQANRVNCYIDFRVIRGAVWLCSRLIAGASANNASAIGGAFTFNVNNAPANANWNNGCGHSYQNKKITF